MELIMAKYVKKPGKLRVFLTNTFWFLLLCGMIYYSLILITDNLP